MPSGYNQASQGGGRKQQIGIMGGTFDPVHVGHLLAAETALDQCGLDQVWFIPTNVPPLKAGDQGTDAETRLRLVRLAIKSQPRFQALPIELERGGVSYSIDTVEALHAAYPEHDFHYIIGSDRIHDLPQWHRIDELTALVRFIGVERPNEPVDLAVLPEAIRTRVTMAAMPPMGISSTDIRQRLLTGQSARYLVPDTVYHEIIVEGLYGSRSHY
ncbi:nicotinate (nicotinamide) nucleotide adenylyltransferase [Paenibacillus curdlanolyticus YK9]|uniref:Probable nicotinate-nucleotide adenylyltransferase n=1 Tax=Paenibacillus curdlanolyticus YK9 TaxID=717606 RepID=E0I344_9BACL|nr:nicotinate-nucleotide adenylyltransferase [Paenibacillus curdlanolyticus]EFM12708.1 nicotinate (nicotinamide) nucleotide adenylyltransferase [Paenibacillus curdlanolyticus YK9]